MNCYNKRNIILSNKKSAEGDKTEKKKPFTKSKKKKEQAKKSRKRAIRRNRKFIEAYKIKNPCPCGEKTPCCLSFHHKNGDKKANISDMVNRGYSIKRMQGEINKCTVLCLNCHARLHDKEKKELLNCNEVNHVLN